MLEEALIRIDADDYQDAYLLYDRAKKLDPELPKLKLVYGLLLMHSKQASQALQLLQEYNKTEDGKLEWRGFAAVGKCCREAKWDRNAVFPLEQAKKLAPATDAGGKPVRALIVVELASVELALRHMKKAKDLAREAESTSPNNSEVQLRVSELYSRTSDFPDAMKSLNRAIGILISKVAATPLNLKEYNSLYSAYDLKLQLCTNAQSAKPTDAVNYIDAAEAIRNKTDIEKKINLLHTRELALKTLATDPKIAALHVFCAGIEMELGALDDALDRLNQVLRIDPSNQEALGMRQAIQARLRGRAKP
jgi:tetratricopeptide (TPR) repeat protein